MAKRKPKGKSGIKIKTSKVGSFTAFCKRHGFDGVTSECIAMGLKSKDPGIRKKANFARNSRGFKHPGAKKK